MSFFVFLFILISRFIYYYLDVARRIQYVEQFKKCWALGPPSLFFMISLATFKRVCLDDSSLPQHGDKVLSGVCAWHRASIQGVVKPALLLQLQVLVTHFTDVHMIKLTQVLPDILKMCYIN